MSRCADIYEAAPILEGRARCKQVGLFRGHHNRRDCGVDAAKKDNYATIDYLVLNFYPS